jgi:hypothetical protein
MVGSIDVDIVRPQDAIRKESNRRFEDEHRNGQERERAAAASALTRRPGGDSRGLPVNSREPEICALILRADVHLPPRSSDIPKANTRISRLRNARWERLERQSYLDPRRSDWHMTEFQTPSRPEAHPAKARNSHGNGRRVPILARTSPRNLGSALAQIASRICSPDLVPLLRGKTTETTRPEFILLDIKHSG